MKKSFWNDDVLLIIYMITFSIKYFANVNVVCSTVVLSLVGTYIFMYTYNKYEYIRKVMQQFIMINSCAFIGLAVNQGHSAFLVLTLTAYEGFGLLLYCTNSNYKLIQIYSNFLFAYICIKVILMYTHGIYIDLSILSRRNTISIELLMIYFIDIIYRIRNKRTLNYAMYLLGLLIAVMCGGSGGMLCLTVFPILVFMCRKYGTRLSKRKIFFILFVGFIAFWGLGYISHFIVFISDDNSRFWIWSRYGELAFSSPAGFIFGARVDSVPFLALQRNMHNTFINFHYFYGLIPFVFYVYMNSISAINLWKQKEFYLLSILFATSLRGFTDAAEFCFTAIWVFLYCQSTLTSKRLTIRRKFQR